MLSSSRILLRLLSVVLLLMFLSACKEDNPAQPDPGGAGEEELITTVTVTLIEQVTTGTPDTVTVQFQDLDGDGGDAPTIGTLTLKAGTTYSGAVELLNEAENPAEDITEEVQAEAEAHQFFFEATGDIAGRVTIDYADKESDYGDNATGDDLQVGLKFTLTVTAGDAASGEFNVVLSHFDEDPKNGTDRSDETDVDINFPVDITQ